MTINHLEAILTHHNIDTALVDGRLYAGTSYTRDGAVYDEWPDVTGFSRADIYAWLGY